MSMVVISTCRVRRLPAIGLKMVLHKRPPALRLVDQTVIMLALGLESLVVQLLLPMEIAIPTEQTIRARQEVHHRVD